MKIGESHTLNYIQDVQKNKVENEKLIRLDRFLQRSDKEQACTKLKLALSGKGIYIFPEMYRGTNVGAILLM